MNPKSDHFIKSLSQIGPESYGSHDQSACALGATKDPLARFQTSWDDVHPLTWREVTCPYPPGLTPKPPTQRSLPILPLAKSPQMYVTLFAKWKTGGLGHKSAAELVAVSGVGEGLQSSEYGPLFYIDILKLKYNPTCLCFLKSGQDHQCHVYLRLSDASLPCLRPLMS